MGRRMRFSLRSRKQPPMTLWLFRSYRDNVPLVTPSRYLAVLIAMCGEWELIEGYINPHFIAERGKPLTADDISARIRGIDHGDAYKEDKGRVAE